MADVNATSDTAERDSPALPDTAERDSPALPDTAQPDSPPTTDTGGPDRPQDMLGMDTSLPQDGPTMDGHAIDMLRLDVPAQDTGLMDASNDSDTPSQARLDEEERIVYREILAQKYSASFYVIQAETDPDATPSNSSAIDPERLSTLLAACSELSAETAGNYQTRNDAAYPLAADMVLPAPYVLITDEEHNQIFGGGSNGWETFYARYPNAHGLIGLSRAGFNASLDQALVYVGNSLGGRAATGYLYVMRKSGSAWSVVCGQMTWMS